MKSSTHLLKELKMDAETLILDTLMRLDKNIVETERDIEFMQKQIGRKLQKLSTIKKERQTNTEALESLRNVEAK